MWNSVVKNLQIDRIYKDLSDCVITVCDRTTGRTVRMRRNRLRDVCKFPSPSHDLKKRVSITIFAVCAAVWNPWEEKEKTMSEFEEGDYKRMVCVGGAVVDPPISVEAGAQWKGRMVLEYFGDCILRKTSGSGSCSSF